MRIEQLDLLAYGPFTDTHLDLSAPGLHLVLGANEAGKSSTLAAITDALFGIPLRTTAGFVHHMTRLEIGMVLRDQRGATLAFRRVKKAKDTLRTVDGAVIPDEALARFLGGVDRATFMTMFGITHDQLVAGGRDLVAGHGELGELLFGASTGSGNLHRTLKQLEDRSALLFKAGGHNPRVNAGISRYKSAASEVRDRALRPRAHDDVIRQIRVLEAALASARQHEAALAAERAATQLLIAVLPNLAARRALMDTLRTERPQTTVLRPGIGAELGRARDALEQSRRRAAHAQRELTRLDAETQLTTVDQAILDVAADIARLREQRGQHRQASHDRPAVASQAAAADERALALVRRLRPALDPAQVRPSLQLAPEAVARVTELAAAATPLVLGAQATARAQSDAEQRGRAAQRALDADPAPLDARLLMAAVAACRADGDLIARRDTVLDAIAEVEHRADGHLARLRLVPAGSPEVLPPALDEIAFAPVPTLAVLQHHEDQLLPIGRDLTRHEEDRAARTCTRDEHQAELDHLVHDEHVPSAADLVEARRVRDHQVEALQAGLQRRGTISDADRSLVDELVQAIRATDELADQLHERAQDVAHRAHLERTVRDDDRAVETLTAAIAADRDRLREAQDAWVAVWDGVPVEVGAPRDMRSWLDTHRRLADEARRLQDLRRELTAVDELIARHRRALASALAALGVEVPPDAWLPTVLSLGTATLAEADRAAGRRAQLVADGERCARELDQAQHAHREAQRRRREWDAAWAAALLALDLPPDLAPAEAMSFVRDAERALEHLDAAAAAADRLQQLDGFIGAFEAQLRAVVTAAAPELDLRDADATAGTLIDRLAAAEAAQARVLALRAEASQHERDAADAARDVAEATAALARLLDEVGAADDREVGEIIDRSERVHAAELELARIEDELRRQSRGQDAAVLEEQLAGRDEAALVAHVQLLDAQLDELRAALDRDGIELGHLQEQRSAMDGSAAAADAAAAAQLALADVARDTEEYLAVHLASLLLRDAVAQYRARHQAPLLDRARPWFARLTAGSFVTLDTDLDTKGQTVLEAVRPDGERVPVAALSEGTRDQLFLALRLAAVALAAAQAEPMPLILDDLFVNFDEDRTRAALAIFGELSAEMQVVLFTHHAHVAELATATLPAHRLHLHQLTPRAVAEPSATALRLRPVS